MGEREPTDAELAAIYATGVLLVADGLAFVQWMKRRVWLLRGIVLMNVSCAAWNATRLGDAEWWWLSAAGVALNAWGAVKAIRVEIDFQNDIKKTLARVRELGQKMQSIERVRHES